jgi:hypothetical protein
VKAQLDHDAMANVETIVCAFFGVGEGGANDGFDSRCYHCFGKGGEARAGNDRVVESECPTDGVEVLVTKHCLADAIIPLSFGEAAFAPRALRKRNHSLQRTMSSTLSPKTARFWFLLTTYTCPPTTSVVSRTAICSATVHQTLFLKE